jgi:outer membrane immunogenic protein
MTKMLAASLFAVSAFAATGAIAADYKVVRPAAVVSIPPPDWSGAFIGIHGGYNWASRAGSYDTSFLFFPLGTTDFDYKLDGYMAGAQIGYNYQFAGSNIVIGVEADGSWLNVKGDAIDENGFQTGEAKINWLATGTAKVGFAASKDLMLYAKGGVAMADFEHTGTVGCDFSNNTVGWTAGVGAELKLTRNLSVKAEYNHVDLGRKSDQCGAFFNILTVETTGKVTMDIAKVGLNLYFK